MTEVSRNDYSFLLYYAGGIAIGCIIVHILPKNEEELERLKATNTANGPQSEEEQETVGKVKSALEKGASSWEGDNIPQEALERIRKQFRLTPKQMDRVMELSKAEATRNPRSPSATPHQQLNRMVYLIMFMVLIYVLNQEYGNVVFVWFVQIFPKEAQILGLIKSNWQYWQYVISLRR